MDSSINADDPDAQTLMAELLLPLSERVTSDSTLFDLRYFCSPNEIESKIEGNAIEAQLHDSDLFNYLNDLKVGVTGLEDSRPSPEAKDKGNASRPTRATARPKYLADYMYEEASSRLVCDKGGNQNC